MAVTKINRTMGAALFSAKDDKKSDPILDIPKIPFDPNRYQQALKVGYCKTYEYKTHIDLQRLHAPYNQPGSGFGAAKLREIVQRTITLKCPGQIKTDASTSYGSPHLFYLYMGMAPETYQASYLKTNFGLIGEEVYEKLLKLSVYKRMEYWNTRERMWWNGIVVFENCFMYRKRHYWQNKEISLDEIIAKRDLLLSLIDKTLDYVSEVFIPRLLKILAADPKNKYPDTKSLGGVNMHLTEQGYARWKYVLENNLEFVPFRNLEHLNLTIDQKTLLKEILDKRAAVISRPE